MTGAPNPSDYYDSEATMTRSIRIPFVSIAFESYSQLFTVVLNRCLHLFDTIYVFLSHAVFFKTPQHPCALTRLTSTLHDRDAQMVGSGDGESACGSDTTH